MQVNRDFSQTEFYLQLNMTLFNPQVGFFGRTYKGASLKLRANQETNELERLPSD